MGLSCLKGCDFIFWLRIYFFLLSGCCVVDGGMFVGMGFRGEASMCVLFEVRLSVLVGVGIYLYLCSRCNLCRFLLGFYKGSRCYGARWYLSLGPEPRFLWQRTLAQDHSATKKNKVGYENKMCVWLLHSSFFSTLGKFKACYLR